jgi:4-amino-4-deoxychorismate lyase
VHDQSRTTLLESICLQDGELPLLAFHQKRVNRSRFALFGMKKQLKLDAFLAEQQLPAQGRYKLRIHYTKYVESFECLPYQLKPVRSLRIVEVDRLDYRFKYADRSALEALYAQRKGCDDILISYRGYLTDSYYANLALYDGQKWWTPAHPLLKGVRREALCEAGQLHPTILRVKDLAHFRELRLINAMIDLADSPPIDLARIYLAEDWL